MSTGVLDAVSQGLKEEDEIVVHDFSEGDTEDPLQSAIDGGAFAEIVGNLSPEQDSQLQPEDEAATEDGLHAQEQLAQEEELICDEQAPRDQDQQDQPLQDEEQQEQPEEDPTDEETPQRSEISRQPPLPLGEVAVTGSL